MKKINLVAAVVLGLVCIFALLAVARSNVRAAPDATCLWVAPQDGVPRNWSGAASWSCGVVPGPGDTAIISGFGRVVTVDAPVTVADFSLLDDSTLNGSHTLTVTGRMLWNANIAGGAHLSPTGAAETLVIAPGAVLSITSGGNPSRLYRGRVVNYGTVEHEAGQMLRMLYAVIDNRAGGTYHVRSGLIDKNNIYTSPDDGGSFSNAGTLLKDGAGLFTLHAALSNTGLVQVLSDTLMIETAGNIKVVTHTGSFSVAPPGTLTLAHAEHNLEPSSSIAGEGTVRFYSAQANVRGAYHLSGLSDISSGAALHLDTPDGAVTLPQVNMGNGARLRGSNDITITGVLTMAEYNAVVEGSSSRANTLNIAPGAKMRVDQTGGLSFRTLNNYGAIEQASGQCFALLNHALFNNHPTGVYTVTSGLMSGCFPFTTASDAVNNHGRIVKLGAGEFSVNYGISTTNSGTIEVLGGVLGIDGPFVQTAGETALTHGSTLRNATTDLLFHGGALRGDGVIDLFQGRRVENSGAIIEPIGLLALDEDYAQGVSGTLRIDVGGLTPVSQHGVFQVSGSASLDGRLTLTPTNDFAPAAGDVFRVMTYGSRSGEFREVERELGLAFGPEYQSAGVVVSDNPTLVEFSQRPDRRATRAEEGNGFTLRAINPTTQTITATLNNVLPVGFRYLSGTLTSSLSVGEPVTSVLDDVQTLAWQQPILLAPSSVFTLHFSVALTTTPNMYTNTATIIVTPTEPSPRQIVTYDTVFVYRPATSDTQVVPSQGVAYPPTEPGAPWQLSFRKGTDLNQVSVALTTTPVCALEACGPLAYVAVVHSGQVFSMTETSPGSNRFHFVIPPGSYVAYEPTYIVPVWLTPVSRATAGDPYEQCRALGIKTGYGCGPPTIDASRFFDPSGHVTDARTGVPIQGATVTLYRVPSALPDTRTATRECRTVDTRPGGTAGGWDLLPPATPNLGLFEDPLFTPAAIDPPLNPQTTDAAGYYGWDVIRGCWYVKVEAPGYFARYSPVVGVPPEVTDLHIALEPWHSVYLPVVVH